MIAIPNMEKPKECIECEFSCLWANGSTHCMVDGEELFCDGIPQRHDCPLIEVVHCKDCKHLGIDNGMPFCWMWVREVENESEIFCSYGERRSDEHTK